MRSTVLESAARSRLHRGIRQQRGVHPIVRDGQRKTHDERRSLSFALALTPHRPAVKLDQLFHDGQPHSQAAVFPPDGGVGLAETIEDVREKLAEIPWPLSSTVISTCEPTRSSATSTVPPSGVNLTALVSRFQTTCCSRFASPRSGPALRIESSIQADSLGFGRGLNRLDRRLDERTGESRCMSSRSFPEMIELMSSRSSTSFVCTRALRSMVSSPWAISASRCPAARRGLAPIPGWRSTESATRAKAWPGTRLSCGWRVRPRLRRAFARQQLRLFFLRSLPLRNVPQDDQDAPLASPRDERRRRFDGHPGAVQPQPFLGSGRQTAGRSLSTARPGPRRGIGIPARPTRRGSGPRVRARSSRQRTARRRR